VCDSAALAGAPLLTGESDCTSIVGAPATAANDSAYANNQLVPKWLVMAYGTTDPGVEVTFPSGSVYDDAGRAVTVNLGEAIRARGFVKVSFLFARVLGFQEANVSAMSTAVMQQAKYFCSDLFVPLSVSSTTILGDSTNPPIVLDPYAPPIVLKVDLWQSNFLGSGNFGPLDFAGNGGSGYRNLLAGKGGVTCWSSNPSDTIPTLPGSKVGPTYQGLQDRIDAETDSRFDKHHDDTAWMTWYNAVDPITGLRPYTKRIIIVPIINVDTTPINGKKSVEIIGMAGFFVEHVVNGKEVWGRFIQGIVSGSNVNWIFPTNGTPTSYQLMYSVHLVS
jgi:hypothetical protein